MNRATKIIAILGGIAMLFLTAAVLVAIYVISEQKKTIGRNRTQAARDNRWKERNPIGEEVPFDNVNENHKDEATSETAASGASDPNDPGAPGQS